MGAKAVDKMLERETLIELFCGAGGMTNGFAPYFDVEIAVDKEVPMVDTYHANHRETDVRRQDVQDLSGKLHDFDGIAGVIGGPPCQGSSIINTKRGADDPRNALMGEFMRLVEEVRPRFFVMENVPSVPAEIKAAVIRQATDAGYSVASHRLDASEYGAAQTRRRWILVGLRGRRWTPPHPRKSRTVRDAFAGIGSNWGFMQCREDTIRKLARAPVGKWAAMSGKFENMTKLSWDTQSLAVVNVKKVYMVHPAEQRPITLAEAAALQGFPSGYVWKGTESDIAQMIANAMPSEMAYAIAGSIATPTIRQDMLTDYGVTS
jgi:DNA (cytosine-5)-methyltransferase 1